MSPSKDGWAKLMTALREARPTDTLGSAAAVVGIILVVSGIVLQKNHGVDFGATIRPLGGLLLLGGLGALLFGESRRRAAFIGAARRVAERYIAATVHWRWTSRWGLAGVATGQILLALALAMEIIFGAFGAIFIVPGLLLFGGGASLLVWGMFHRRGAGRKPPRSSGEGGGDWLPKETSLSSRGTPRTRGRITVGDRGRGSARRPLQSLARNWLPEETSRGQSRSTPRTRGRSTVGGRRRGATRKAPQSSQEGAEVRRPKKGSLE